MFPDTLLAQENPELSDAEVAHAAVTANQIDIDYAALAKEKSENAEILKFAETMSTDHKAVIDQAVALVQKLGVTPADNAVSKKLLADAEETRKALRAKSGDAFEVQRKNMVESQVRPSDVVDRRVLRAMEEIPRELFVPEAVRPLAYIDNEVVYHKAVISAVEGLLIPEAEHAELKALLQNVVPALQAHLDHAEMVQSQLNEK